MMSWSPPPCGTCPLDKSALRLHMLHTVSRQVGAFVFFLWLLESPGSDLLPKKRARLKVPEDEESPSPSPCGVSKRRRRCRVCSTKLELVQQEMGSCRCGTSTQLHTRQHACTSDRGPTRRANI